MDISIPESFEKPTQEEWDTLLGTKLFNDLRIDEELLPARLDIHLDVKNYNLIQLIKAYNNRVGSLNITYVLCKHYYDKGMPEQHEGKDGWYYTNFTKEHMIRRYWFCYYADAFYVQIFSIWDMLLNIINQYYDLGIKIKSGFADDIKKGVKKENVKLWNVVEGIYNSELQNKAYGYRIKSAHGLSLGEVSSKLVVTVRDTIISPSGKELLEGEECDGKRKAKKYSYSIEEEYVEPKEVMDNIDSYTKSLGRRIQKILRMMVEPVQPEEPQIIEKAT
jgi:hypothetical protein